MARCDQCHIEGGIKIGKGPKKKLSARFEFIVGGAKMNLCEGHLQRMEKEFRGRKMEIKYHELRGEENE